MAQLWQPLLNLRVNQAGIAVYPRGATFGPRRLQDFEFLWMIEGDAVAYFDDERLFAPVGSVLLGRPGLSERYEWSATKRTAHAYLHFSFDLPGEGWPPLKTWPLIRQMPPDDVLCPLFRYVVSLCQIMPLDHALLAPALNLMVRAFVSGKTTIGIESRSDLPPSVDLALHAVREALAHDPPQPITLARLAKTAHVTPAHLCRLFRRSLNLGVLEYVGLARLERAASLLARSNLPVKQVADSTGFCSQYHFSSKFKKIYGLSPRDYRNCVRAGVLTPLGPLVRVLQAGIPQQFRA